MVKNPGPKTHFFDKTHKTQFQKKRRHFFGKKKPRRDTKQLANRWVGGAGPGPNRNKISRDRSKIGQDIPTKSVQKTHFFEKTHKTHFQKKKTSLFRKKKAPQGYYSASK